MSVEKTSLYIGLALVLVAAITLNPASLSEANAAKKTCIDFSVQNAYDSGDFYAFSLSMTNKCTKVVKFSGELFAKTSNGSVFGRPSNAIISFRGNNICGSGNYFSGYLNPRQRTSNTICLSVTRGMTITSFFFAQSPVSKPILAKSVRITLR
jgi:hypothetical protein